jgi:hypothetical protein
MPEVAGSKMQELLVACEKNVLVSTLQELCTRENEEKPCPTCGRSSCISMEELWTMVKESRPQLPAYVKNNHSPETAMKRMLSSCEKAVLVDVLDLLIEPKATVFLGCPVCNEPWRPKRHISSLDLWGEILEARAREQGRDAASFTVSVTSAQSSRGTKRRQTGHSLLVDFNEDVLRLIATFLASSRWCLRWEKRCGGFNMAKHTDATLFKWVANASFPANRSIFFAGRTCDDISRLALWDVEALAQSPTLTTRVATTFQVNSRRIKVCRLSPSGKLILCGDQGGKMQVWEVESGQLRITTDFQSSSVSSCCFNPNETVWGVAVLSQNDVSQWEGCFKMCSTATGECQKTVALPGYADSCSFSPDGNFIQLGGRDFGLRCGYLKVFATAGELEATCAGVLGTVTCSEFAPCGKSIVGSCQLGTHIWDARSGQIQHTLRAEFDADSGYTSVAWSPDGSIVCTGGDSGRAVGRLRLWCAKTGCLLQNLRGGKKRQRACDCDFAPNSKSLVASFGINIEMWNLTV